MEGVYKSLPYDLGIVESFITPFILPMSETTSTQFLDAATDSKKSKSNFM